MRMLMHIKLPNAKFNAVIKEGRIQQNMLRILEEIKPEVVCFTEYDGRRGANMIVNLNDPSNISGLAEPWFLLFEAEVQFHIVMSSEELGRADCEAIAKKWSQPAALPDIETSMVKAAEVRPPGFPSEGRLFIAEGIPASPAEYFIRLLSL